MKPLSAFSRTLIHSCKLTQIYNAAFSIFSFLFFLFLYRGVASVFFINFNNISDMGNLIQVCSLSIISFSEFVIKQPFFFFPASNISMPYTLVCTYSCNPLTEIRSSSVRSEFYFYIDDMMVVVGI